MIFHLNGHIKPYVRMTQRSKWVDRQAQEYIGSKTRLGRQMKQIMADHGFDMLPRCPLRVKIEILMTGGVHRCDLDNQVKALLDAAQGIVFPDDRWVDVVEAHRIKSDEDLTILQVERWRGREDNK